MARLNDSAQWIVLMGFIVSLSFFFLALVINQSTVVGQTTAESVIEFPKNDIRDVRNVIGNSTMTYSAGDLIQIQTDIPAIAMNRKGAVVWYQRNISPTTDNLIHIEMHYNNGVTEYHEDWARW